MGHALNVDGIKHYPAKTLRTQVDACLTSWGMPTDHVEVTARVIVDADECGIDTHGIALLTTYDRLRRAGRVTMAPSIEVVRENAVSALIDGGGSLGVIVGISVDHEALDPVRVGTTVKGPALESIFQSLTERGMPFQSDGEIHMAVATSIEPNEENTVWTVKIRDDVLWHNGEPLTAEDVAYTFNLFTTETGPELSGYGFFSTVEEAVVIDDSTVEIRMSEPNATMLTDVGIPTRPQLYDSNDFTSWSAEGTLGGELHFNSNGRGGTFFGHEPLRSGRVCRDSHTPLQPSNNWGGYYWNPEFDEYLWEATQTMANDYEGALEALAATERISYNDASYIFLWYDTNVFGVREGLNWSPPARHDFNLFDAPWESSPRLAD